MGTHTEAAGVPFKCLSPPQILPVRSTLGLYFPTRSKTRLGGHCHHRHGMRASKGNLVLSPNQPHQLCQPSPAPSVSSSSSRGRAEGVGMPWEALSRALGGQAPPRSLRGFSQREKLNGLLNSTNDQSSAPWKISIAAFDYWIAIKSLKPCQVLGT